MNLEILLHSVRKRTKQVCRSSVSHRRSAKYLRPGLPTFYYNGYYVVHYTTTSYNDTVAAFLISYLLIVKIRIDSQSPW